MERKRSVKNNAGNKFTLVVECDITGLNKEQVEDYAFDAIWIKEQTALREMSNKAFEDLKGKYSFKAIPKGIRKAKSKTLTTDELVNAIKGKSREERLAAIEQLKALDE